MTRFSSCSNVAIGSALLLVASSISGVEARTCGYDQFGRYRCTGWAGGLYAGVILAIVIPILLILIGVMTLVRRRRARKANMAYMQNSQPQMQESSGAGGYYQGGPNNMYPQQQPQFNQYPSANNYYRGENAEVVDNSANAPAHNPPNYAPPMSPPPVANTQQYYAAPQGPPPSFAGGKGPENRV